MEKEIREFHGFYCSAEMQEIGAANLQETTRKIKLLRAKLNRMQSLHSFLGTSTLIITAAIIILISIKQSCIVRWAGIRPSFWKGETNV